VVELGEEKQNPRTPMPARAKNDHEHDSDIAWDGAVPCVSVRRGCKFEKRGRHGVRLTPDCWASGPAQSAKWARSSPNSLESARIVFYIYMF
jgi:hypothetical protein